MSVGYSSPDHSRHLANTCLSDMQQHFGEKKAWHWVDLSQYFLLEYFLLDHDFEQKDDEVKCAGDRADFSIVEE